MTTALTLFLPLLFLGSLTTQEMHPQKCGCSYTYEEKCFDGEDNDYDGFVDCEDADCQYSVYCDLPEGELCDTGVDEDGDGYVDCDDEACISYTPCQDLYQLKDGYDDPYFGCGSAPMQGSPHGGSVLLFLGIILLIRSRP